MLLFHPTGGVSGSPDTEALTLDRRGKVRHHRPPDMPEVWPLDAPAQAIAGWDDAHVVVAVAPPVLELRAWDGGESGARLRLPGLNAARRWDALTTINKNRALLAAATDNGVIALLDYTRRSVSHVQLSGQRVAALSLTDRDADHALLAGMMTTRHGGFLRVWSVREGRAEVHMHTLERRDVDAPTAPLASVRGALRWHPDGRRLIVYASCPDDAWPHAGWRGEVSVYDCASGHALWSSALDARSLGDPRSNEALGYPRGAPGALHLEVDADEVWCATLGGVIARLDLRDGALLDLIHPRRLNPTSAITGIARDHHDALCAVQEEGALLHLRV